MKKTMMLAGLAGICLGLNVAAAELPYTAGSANEAARARFAELTAQTWPVVFRDAFTGPWQEQWTLDGKHATLSNGPEGLAYAAGPELGNDAHHAVLWTKASFTGDCLIRFHYIRTDTAVNNVNILYIQATGDGTPEHPTDIAQWADRRTVPAMKVYFEGMDIYHISFAAFDNKNPGNDYIRLRRYLPLRDQGMKDTDVLPDYQPEGLFATGVPHTITVLKVGQEIFMEIVNPERRMLCHWENKKLPPILAGRIGLRHMYGRSSVYKDFTIAQPAGVATGGR